ncbi:MAG TPA: hypothetical protein VL980_02655, partial [Gemmatimonadaceae bacterium]|nr:hypothetical protein [Gemmatimonadaceae bacterium]
GPLVPPGKYTLTLSVNGARYASSVVVVNDPRSPASVAALRAQYALQMKIVAAMRASYAGAQQAVAMRAALDSIIPKDTSAAVTATIKKFRVQFDSIAGGAGGARTPGRPIKPPTDFASLNARLTAMLNAQENGDLAPTPAMQAEFAAACKDVANTVAKWKALNATAVPALSAELEKNGIRATPEAAGVTAPKC